MVIRLGSLLLACSLLAAVLAATAQAKPSAYVLEQREGSNSSIITLSSAGLRYEALAPRRAGGTKRGKRAKPVLAVAIRYGDGQVLLVDLQQKQYQQLQLRSAVARYEAEVKAIAKAQPSAKLPPAPGAKGTSGQVSLKPPAAHLRALGLSARIGGLPARAYLLTQGSLRERLWYSSSLPGPPAPIRATLAKALGGSGSLARALNAHAAQIPLRIDEARGKRWRTVLRTTRVRHGALSAKALTAPHGFAKKASAAGSRAHSASVPADPIRCGVTILSPIGCITEVTDGPISEHPAIWAFYWGPRFAEHTDLVSSINKGLEDMVGDQFAGPGSSTFGSGLGQYGVHRGKLLGYEIDSGKAAPSVGSWNFADVIAYTFTHRFGSDAPNYWWRWSDEDPIFAVFVDQSEVASSGWGGYHFFTPSEGILFSFLVHPAIPWFIVKVPGLNTISHERQSPGYLSALDTTTERASHEFAETATDPYPFLSWSDPLKEPIWEKGEIGDICEEESYPWGKATRTEKRGTAVDPYWSNEANACVPEARPTGQIVFPTGEQTYSWGAEATFIVRTDDIFDGSVPDREITWNDEVTHQELGQGFVFTTRSLSPGNHRIYARIADSQGGVRVTDPITVHVVVRPPAVAISGPAKGSTYGSDQFINFRGSALDPHDGDIGANATWLVDGATVGKGATLLTHNIPTEGTHTITLTATDSGGATSSASTSVVVGSPVGKPSVVITSPENGSFFAPGEPIKFNAEAQALGAATVSEYVWSDDLDGLLGATKEVTHTLSGFACGGFTQHHVSVTVTDSLKRTATDTIEVNDGQVC
jgi:hypothetical protein